MTCINEAFQSKDNYILYYFQMYDMFEFVKDNLTLLRIAS